MKKQTFFILTALSILMFSCASVSTDTPIQEDTVTIKKDTIVTVKAVVIDTVKGNSVTDSLTK